MADQPRDVAATDDAQATAGRGGPAEAAPWDRTDWTARGIKDWNVAVIAGIRANGGRVGWAYAGGDLPLLTTTGARTGRRRAAPLGYPADGERLVLSSFVEAAYPAWYHNLRADPAVTVELGGETFAAAASVATGEERARLWARVTERWPLLAEHQAMAPRPLPPVVLRR